AVRLGKPFVVEEGQSAEARLSEAGFSATPNDMTALGQELRAAGHDGLVINLPEDLRDPSDPYPARQLVRALAAANVKPVTGEPQPFSQVIEPEPRLFPLQAPPQS